MKTLQAAVLSGFLVFGLMLVPVAARCQGGLELYSDPGLTQCALSDAAPGTVNVYLALEGISHAVRFRIASSAGFSGTWLSDSTPYAHFGSSQTDMGVHFGACKAGKFLVATMTYQLFGTSTCSELYVAPPIGYSFSICMDCFEEFPCGPNASLHVNCPGPFDCDPVAVEPTTWGKVKSLYRN